VLDVVDNEGQVEECGEDATREGKRRVLRTGQTASASAGHYQPAGQGVHYTTDHQLLEDESSLSRRSVFNTALFTIVRNKFIPMHYMEMLFIRSGVYRLDNFSASDVKVLIDSFCTC